MSLAVDVAGHCGFAAELIRAISTGTERSMRRFVHSPVETNEWEVPRKSGPCLGFRVYKLGTDKTYVQSQR